MGVGTLLESKQIVLLVTGEAKADILRRTIEGPMSADSTGILAAHRRSASNGHCR